MLFPYCDLENHPSGVGDLNAIFNGNWKHIANWFNPAHGLTCSQDSGVAGVAGNQLRANGAIFTSDDVGATVRFADGATAQISAFTSSTVVTATDSKLETAQAFEIYRTDQSDKTVLPRGLVKKVRFVSGDDAKILVWDHANLKFALITRPGYGATLGQILYGAGAGADATSSADLLWDNTAKTLTLAGRTIAKNYEFTHATLASGSSITIDFLLEGLRSINTLAANATFSTSNRAAGRQQSIRIVCDGTTRNLTWPGTWKWLNNTAPASIAANKTGVLSLTCFGTNDSDVVAVWAVEA